MISLGTDTMRLKKVHLNSIVDSVLAYQATVVRPRCSRIRRRLNAYYVYDLEQLPRIDIGSLSHLIRSSLWFRDNRKQWHQNGPYVASVFI